MTTLWGLGSSGAVAQGRGSVNNGKRLPVSAGGTVGIERYAIKYIMAQRTVVVSTD